jgi:hypothetical protein
MDVIGHQHEGVQAAALAPQGLAQPVKVGVAILIVEEAGAAFVATLNGDAPQEGCGVDSRLALCLKLG